MNCTKNIDWDLLTHQKLVLANMLMKSPNSTHQFDSEEYSALEGILNLLDEMTDENYHNNN